MQSVQPAKHQLFCKNIEGEKKTASGILLSDHAVERPKIAEVINVGTAVEQYKPHDHIIYKSYSTTEIKLNDETYLLVSEEDVLGNIVDV